MITTNDINGLIALAIVNNKPAFAQAIGLPVTTSDEDLMQAGMFIYSNKGFDIIKAILMRVPLDRSKLNTAQQNTLIRKFELPVNPSAKCSWKTPLECLTGAVDYVGDLIGGHSSTNVAPVIQQQSSTPALPTWAIIATVVAGLAGIFIFRKFTAVIVGIIVIVFAVVLYGIFVKTTTTTTSGGGSNTTSSGGIGSSLVGFFTGLFGG